MRVRHSRRIARVRRGFSLVEAMIAVSLLAIVLSSLAALSFHVAKRSREVSGLSYRAAAMLQHANRLSVLPFDSLASRVGCETMSSPPYPHTRCVSVDSVSARVKKVTLVVAPATAGFRGDTTVFWRTNGIQSTPFNSP